MYKPLPDKAPLPDKRDDEERTEVGRIISVLPEEHSVHEAHRRGTDTIALTRLVAERPDLVEALIRAYHAGADRVSKRAGHFKP